LKATLILGAFLKSEISFGAEIANNLPNIVIFVSDDMGWNDVGYHGSLVNTPHIDSLARDGVQLNRFYVFPVCSPTRTALMTGRSPIRFGITHAMGRREGVPLDEHFLPAAFKAAGYQTFMVGKWHLGADDEKYKPQSRGFDHFYGFLGGIVDYYTHFGAGEVLDWQRNGKTLEEDGYSTDLFAAEAVRLLKNRDKKKPVFLYIPFNAPHGPAQAPEAIIQKYEKLGLHGKKKARLASIDSMDQAIGRVLDTLGSEGMAANTLTMFFCDNGAGGGRGRGAGATGGTLRLREGKGSVYEGGVRVPAVIRWPNIITAGSKSDQLVSVLDLLPTLASAAGIKHRGKKPLDGVNIWEAIRDGDRISRKPFAVGTDTDLAILKDYWKLVKIENKYQLFDLASDPTESKDIAKKHRKVLSQLKKLLAPYEKMMREHPSRSKSGKKRKRQRGNAPKR